jgi:hypothetical protein
MLPCSQGHTDSNGKERRQQIVKCNQSAKHEFECSKRQGLRRMANGMPIKIKSTICLKNEVGRIWNQIKNNVNLTHIKKIIERLL